MKRIFVALGVSLVGLALLAIPACACRNDRDTSIRETEFKAQYDRSANPESATPAAEESPSMLDLVLLSTGSFLGVGALGLGIGAGIMASRKSA